jgi:hypothetical protein
MITKREHMIGLVNEWSYQARVQSGPASDAYRECAEQLLRTVNRWSSGTTLNPRPCPQCGVRYTGPGHEHVAGQPAGCEHEVEARCRKCGQQAAAQVWCFADGKPLMMAETPARGTPATGQPATEHTCREYHDGCWQCVRALEARGTPACTCEALDESGPHHGDCALNTVAR